jgi:hypothetical protein
MNNTFALTAKKEFEVAYDGQVSGNGVFALLLMEKEQLEVLEI